MDNESALRKWGSTGKNMMLAEIMQAGDDLANCLIKAQSELAAVTAERDALKKDAERYRWLRDKGNYSPSDMPCIRSGPLWRMRILESDECDAAIDAVKQSEGE